MFRSFLAAVVALVLVDTSARAADPVPLAKGVRGLVTRASAGVNMDGRLDEWAGAFCTPVHYNHGNLANRGAQFFYLWDDQALYIGLRALDQKRANPGKERAVFNGDAVEFYLDTRSGTALRWVKLVDFERSIWKPRQNLQLAAQCFDNLSQR